MIIRLKLDHQIKELLSCVAAQKQQQKIIDFYFDYLAAYEHLKNMFLGWTENLKLILPYNKPILWQGYVMYQISYKVVLKLSKS